MNAVQLVSGSGGWPLNAFALPDGKPFFAGTYYNRAQWMELLSKISTLYKNDNQKIVKHSFSTIIVLLNYRIKLTSPGKCKIISEVFNNRELTLLL